MILGCTHYPLVRPMLQRELGRRVTLIARAEELAGEVAETLRRKGLGRDDDRRGDYRFVCTGDPDAFAASDSDSCSFRWDRCDSSRSASSAA